MSECFCINISNTSASNELKKFVIAIMSLDLLVSEGQCSTFVKALRVAHTNNTQYTHTTRAYETYHQYFIQSPALWGGGANGSMIYLRLF